MQVFALFHPATGFPQAAYVWARDLDTLTRHAVFVTETISQSSGGGGAWPEDIAEMLCARFGYARASRPSNPSDVMSVDVHLEHRFPLREGGVGDIHFLMTSITEDLSRS